MKKYVVETWYRIEKTYDEKEEAERMVDLYNRDEEKRYQNTKLITLTDGT